MCKSDIVFDRALHKKLWMHLAEHPLLSKEEAIMGLYENWEVSKSDFLKMAEAKSNCLACEYAKQARIATLKENKYADTELCNYCPLNYRHVEDTTDNPTCLAGLYYEFMDKRDEALGIDKFLNLLPSTMELIGAKMNMEEYTIASREKVEMYFRYLMSELRDLAMEIANLPVHEGVICA